jgi:hypothetical protein
MHQSASPSKPKRPHTAKEPEIKASSGYGPSPKKSPSKKGPQIHSLVDLVKKKDRLTCEQVVGYLQDFLATQARLQDPLDDIESIFNKIQDWKKSFGDLDKQEKMIT